MTVESIPTPPTESTPATPTESAAPPSARRAERRARAEAMIAKTPPTPTAPAKPDTSEEPAAGTASDKPTPSPSKLDAIKAKLAEQAKAREAKKAEAAKDERIAKLEERIANARTPQDEEAIIRRVIDEIERNPAATARKYGKDPRKLVERLTNELISPQAQAALQAAESQSAELKKTNERLDRYEQAEAERRQQEAYAAERKAIVEHVTTDKSRWGRLAKLPEARRLWWCVTAANALAEAGHEYDREIVADTAEALLEEDQKHLVPPDPPPAPSHTEQSQAATRKPTKTLTPDMAAPSGSKRPKTRHERKQALVAQLERERTRSQ